MSGDLSSHGDIGGTSWRRLSLNNPQLLLYRNFDSAVDLIMQLGGNVSALGIFFYPCPTSGLLGVALRGRT